jgi:hypothetical protein
MAFTKALIASVSQTQLRPCKWQAATLEQVEIVRFALVHSGTNNLPGFKLH